MESPPLRFVAKYLYDMAIGLAMFGIFKCIGLILELPHVKLDVLRV
jgi:hypothetical protein